MAPERWAPKAFDFETQQGLHPQDLQDFGKLRNGSWITWTNTQLPQGPVQKQPFGKHPGFMRKVNLLI